MGGYACKDRESMTQRDRIQLGDTRPAAGHDQVPILLSQAERIVRDSPETALLDVSTPTVTKEDDGIPADSGCGPSPALIGDAQAAERNPLRKWVREVDEAKRLIRRLVGELLPEVELQTPQSGRERLLSLLSDIAVVYFVPGDKDEPYEDGYPTPDTSQHRGYVNRKAYFEKMRVQIICVSSQPAAQLLGVGHYFDFSHLMLSDPNLEIAQALDLPTVCDGDIFRYRRLTLITNGGQIAKVFYPLQSRDAVHSARQAVGWIEGSGLL